jgi:CheY-like chemotaxis protein
MGGGGATILLCEDDPAYGEALGDLLRREGHAVHHVTDGEAAIACVREMGERLDLVLCDLLLPKRTGFEVVKEVRDLDLGVAVLAMTSVYENMREIHALRGLGVSGYVHKSTPFEQLLFRINNMLFPCTDNQRGNYRVAVSIPVQFKRDTFVSYGTSYNLSITGVYVRSPEPVVIGGAIEMALSLPTAREMVRLTGEVMHSATPREVWGTAYPSGFGVRFFEVSGLAQTAIGNFVEAVHLEETMGEGLGCPKFDLVESEDPVAAR